MHDGGQICNEIARGANSRNSGGVGPLEGKENKLLKGTYENGIENVW